MKALSLSLALLFAHSLSAHAEARNNDVRFGSGMWDGGNGYRSVCEAKLGLEPAEPYYTGGGGGKDGDHQMVRRWGYQNPSDRKAMMKCMRDSRKEALQALKSCESSIGIAKGTKPTDAQKAARKACVDAFRDSMRAKTTVTTTVTATATATNTNTNTNTGTTTVTDTSTATATSSSTETVTVTNTNTSTVTVNAVGAF